MGKILAVDDDLGILKVVKFLLEKQGHDVVAAEDGAQALEAVNDGQFDLLLLDLGLPEVDGLEVYKQIKENPDLSALKIIIMSGNDEESSKKRSELSGEQEFIQKPFQSDDLIARVNAILSS